MSSVSDVAFEVVGSLLVAVVAAAASPVSAVWISSDDASAACSSLLTGSSSSSGFPGALRGGARFDTDDEVEFIDPVRTLFKLLESG